MVGQWQVGSAGNAILIHTPTLFLVLTALCFLAAFSFALQTRGANRREARIWMVAYLFAALFCISSLGLFAKAPNLAVMVPHLFSMPALALMHRGLSRHFNMKPEDWVFLPPLVWAGLALFVWAGEPLDETYFARRIVLCSIFAIYGLATCGLIWRTGRLSAARIGLLFTFGVYALFYLVRLAVLSPGLAPIEAELADFWLQLSVYKVTLFLVANGFLFHALLRERDERLLRQAAHLDPLTGLSNRRAFALQASRLRREGRAMVLAVLDLDHFKSVNDSCGHAVGDAVLREFATLLVERVELSDACARLGGEEFAILMSGETVEGAERRLVELAGAFGEVCARQFDLPAPATFSAGLAADRSDVALSDLMVAADQALYRAKNSGRNRIMVAEASFPAAPSCGVTLVITP